MGAVIRGMLMLTAAQAAEDVQSANYILPGCQQFLMPANQRDLKLAVHVGLCLGEVDAVSFVLVANKVLLQTLPAEQPEKRTSEAIAQMFCADLPQGVNNGQKIRVVVAYIEKHPNRMHENFTNLAIEAIKEAWPCRKLVHPQLLPPPAR